MPHDVLGDVADAKAAHRAADGADRGHLTIPTTPAGHSRLLEWVRDLGSDPRFGVEGTRVVWRRPCALTYRFDDRNITPPTELGGI